MMNEMRTVDVRGGELAYAVEREGDGPPVVLLHPVMTSRTVWEPHVDYLDSNTAIIVALRGHGETGPTSVETYSYDLFADDLAALVETLDGRPVLAGCSLGAQTALLYARDHPNAVTGVVAAGVAPLAGPMQYLAPVVERLQYGLTKLLGYDRLHRLLPVSETNVDEEGYWRLRELLTDDDSRWETTTLSTLLEDIDVPVTLVRGPSENEFDSDVMTHEGVNIETVPEGGHLASVKCSAEFATIVEQMARRAPD